MTFCWVTVRGRSSDLDLDCSHGSVRAAFEIFLRMRTGVVGATLVIPIMRNMARNTTECLYTDEEQQENYVLRVFVVFERESRKTRKRKSIILSVKGRGNRRSGNKINVSIRRQSVSKLCFEQIRQVPTEGKMKTKRAN